MGKSPNFEKYKESQWVYPNRNVIEKKRKVDERLRGKKHAHFKGGTH